MRKCLYEKITLAGNFNAQEGEQLLHTFLYQHELHSINKNPTCYKNVSNLTLIQVQKSE